MRQVVVPVVLSGGSGTRLWPLSRSLHPKQFLPLVSSRSLFQETLLRLEPLRGLADVELARPIVVCNEAHRFLVAEQLRELDIAPDAIVLEPAGRNTAPAVAIAALHAERASAGGGEPLLLVLPADHVIADRAAFATAVGHAVAAAATGALVTFGVVPDRPETGYGYIRRGAEAGGWAALDQFVEKPDLATAERYLRSGQYLWNSGMFVFSAKSFLAELGRHAGEMLAACRRAFAEAVRDADFTRLGAAFAACPADSIDYAVMEKTSSAAVVPLAAGWNDVGSWLALHDVLDKDADGNALRGDVVAVDCANSYVAAHSRLVAAVGLRDAVVIETRDAVLVMARDRAQAVKQVVDRLSADQRTEVRQSALRPPAETD